MTAASTRDDTFDFIKGVLVLLMVLYHVMSITSVAAEEHFRYIRFISGSFIFVSGYLVARFIGKGFRKAPGPVARRLAIRGVKILLIFAVLNFLIHAAGFGNVGKVQLGAWGFLRESPVIFLRGDGRISSFLILLPIGYMLMLAPLVIALSVVGGGVATWIMLVAAIGLAAVPAVWHGVPVVEFLLVGLIGMLAGLLRSRYPSLGSQWRIGLLISGLGLLGAVWLSGHSGINVATYSLSIAVVLLFMYAFGAALLRAKTPTEATILLGRYSLLAYIAQIVVIQVGFRALGGQRTEVGILTLGMCVGTAILLIVGIRLLEHMRKRSALVDRCYRAVFT